MKYKIILKDKFHEINRNQIMLFIIVFHFIHSVIPIFFRNLLCFLVKIAYGKFNIANIGSDCYGMDP